MAKATTHSGRLSRRDATPTSLPSGHRVGYIRVSSLDQNTARQLDGLVLHKVFTDHASGGTANRPQLAEALRYVREGDCLVVHSMDPLARNPDDLRRIVRDLTGRGVAVEFIKEGQTFTAEGANAMGNLMLSMLGAFAEFERSLIRERQREGIALARQQPGKYKGRAPALTEQQAEQLRARDRQQQGKGRAALAREFGISRQTLYQYLRWAATEASGDLVQPCRAASHASSMPKKPRRSQSSDAA